jgi:hypothetical protein
VRQADAVKVKEKERLKERHLEKYINIINKERHQKKERKI